MSYTNLCFRAANIESSHGHQVTQLRKQYTQQDKELIKEFLEAKMSFSLKSETPVQRFEEFRGKGLYGKNG